MTTVKRLMDEAMDRPLRDADPADLAYAARRLSLDIVPTERIADYEAAVDALDELARLWGFVFPEDEPEPYVRARAALRRLRGA